MTVRELRGQIWLYGGESLPIPGTLNVPKIGDEIKERNGFFVQNRPNLSSAYSVDDKFKDIRACASKKFQGMKLNFMDAEGEGNNSSEWALDSNGINTGSMNSWWVTGLRE